MKLVFTICSNNYLAQAKALGDSIKKHNPDYKFIIGLVDIKSSAIDYNASIAYDLLPIDEIGIEHLDDLWKRYDIVELNTCVKPFFFKYFIEKYSSLEYLYYLDPDTCVFNSLANIETEFQDGNVLLTPHIYTPIALDGKNPSEATFLNFGIYNLGFLGFKNPQKCLDIVSWWKERTYNLCYIRPNEGLFVDQIWFNLVPILFQSVKVSENLGLNMAPWNLHERIISKKDSAYFVNDKFPLVFYHFSNYKISNPEKISNDFYDRYSFSDRPDLKYLYSEYNKELTQNDFAHFSVVECEYIKKRNDFYYRPISKKKILFIKTKKFFKLIIPPIFHPIFMKN